MQTIIYQTSTHSNNQSTHESDEITNHQYPIDQSIKHSSNQPTKLVSQSLYRSINQGNQLIKHQPITDQSIDEAIKRSANHSTQ